MVIKLYGVLSSPPVRASMLTLNALKLSYEFVEIDFRNKQHLSPEFLEMNPQHTVPTLVDDDGFVVYDSHAIMAYLVDKYAEDDKLYPKDLKKRSMVDRRMYFEDGILFASIKNIVVALMWEKTETELTEKMVTKVEENCYKIMEAFLTKSKYAAGEEITIADFSIVTTLSNSNWMIPIDKEKFPLVVDYMKRCQENIADFEDITDKSKKIFLTILKEYGFPMHTLKMQNES